MTRDEIERLLPFLANGTLDKDERDEVEAAVARDPELAAELEALQAIRARMRETGVQSPGEFGLMRLRRDIDRAEAAALSQRWRGGRGWRIAAALALAVAIGVAALLPRDPDYRLADAPDEAVFRVTFAETATEAAIRDTLIAAGVEIVEGPSALGIYGLAPLPGTDPAAAEAALSAAGGVVTSLDGAED